MRRLESIRARLRRQEGFTLIEVLVSASLLVVVLTATLNTLDGATQTQRRTEKLNDQQERVRLTLEQMARQLRNLASPTTSAVTTVDRAEPYDFIFQTTDPNKQWVRYCLSDTTISPAPFSGYVGGTSSNSVIWYQTPNAAFTALNPQQPPTQVSGMTGACPATPAAAGTPGWSSARVVSANVTNKVNAQDRPLFAYNGSPSTDTSTVTYVRTDVWGRFATAQNNVRESRLSTGEYLRNQNQVPTAAISLQQGQANARAYQLNGTGSSDPEGRTLASFLWYKGTPQASATASSANLPSCVGTDTTKTTSGQTWTCIGSGALLNYTFPAGDGTGGTENNRIAVALKVTDPGGLSGYATVNGVLLS